MKGTRGKGILRRCLLGLGVGLLALLVCFGVSEAAVCRGDYNEIKARPEAVVVLGTQMWGDHPSPELRSRLDTALAYVTALEAFGCEPVVVVSGGKSETEWLSEAEGMADYLEANGFPPERIIQEYQSNSTAENLRFSKAALAQAGVSVSHVTLVSNGYHLARVRLLAKRLAPEWTCSTLSAPTPQTQWTRENYCREALALLKSLLLDR